MNKIGDAFAAALNQMLEENKKLTIEKAARRLGVTRQAFHAYLNGKLPRRKRLNMAMHIWNLKLDIGKHSFDKEAFGREEPRRSPPGPRQPTLWEALDAVSEENLRISVKRVGKVFRVNVEIEIPA